MMRLDKYLADLEVGTRSQVKVYLKKGLVTVNGAIEKRPEYKIKKETDLVSFRGKTLVHDTARYYMFHKPAGCVSANCDNLHKTVLDYFTDIPSKDLILVGRLDIDTEGLLFVTNDGEWCHNLLAPKKHVPKTYFARIKGEVLPADVSLFAAGIAIGDHQMTKPAELFILSSGAVSEINLTIVEGKFHQVKRMFEAVGKKVLYLKRISMGAISLDENLPPGAYRALTQAEIEALKCS